MTRRANRESLHACLGCVTVLVAVALIVFMGVPFFVWNWNLALNYWFR